MLLILLCLDCVTLIKDPMPSDWSRKKNCKKLRKIANYLAPLITYKNCNLNFTQKCVKWVICSKSSLIELCLKLGKKEPVLTFMLFSWNILTCKIWEKLTVFYFIYYYFSMKGWSNSVLAVLLCDHLINRIWL